MSAKKMFKELGYEEIEKLWAIEYKKGAKIICFRNDKVIIPYEDYGDGKENGTLLSLKEFKAIQQQITELGWESDK